MDARGNFVEQQSVIGGASVSVSIVSTNSSVGTISNSPVSIRGGTNNASTNLQAVAQGTTTVTAASTGFSSAQVAATVTNFTPPLLFSNGDTTIGQNLESQYTVTLPQDAGPNGAQITVLSSSANVQVSASAAGAGSQSIALTLSPNTRSTTFYVQGRANSGTAIVTATASGFESAIASIQLVPAAIVIFPTFATGTVGSSTSVSLFPALLDSANTPTGTSQLLAGPLSTNVSVNSDNPTVATVPTSITFQAGTNNFPLPITYGTAGRAIISLTEPTGFTVPNSLTAEAVTVN